MILPVVPGVHHVLLPLLAIGALAAASSAQSNDSLLRQPARPVFSIGQPPSWRPYTSASAFVGTGSTPGLSAVVGIERPVLNPVTGLLGAAGEAFGEQHTHGDGGAGLRLLATVPAFGFAFGADWRATSGDVDAIWRFQTAVRRGGLLGGGSMLRLDWLPRRRRTFAAGVQVPLAQPFAGRTRPRRTSVEMPSASGSQSHASATTLAPTAERALQTLADAATVIAALTNLYSEENERTLIAARHTPYGRSYDGATSAYRRALAAAFASAAGDSTLGEELAARARAGMLADVILPYDALFGQVKDDRGIDGMLDVAREHFARWLRDSSAVAPALRENVVAVQERWLAILDGVCRQLLGQWKDSRLVWLPPQLTLAPEEYDEQAEVDSLIARVVGHPFTNDNALTYLRTADLPLEIARSIMAARKYHVLWTHDFTGRRPSGELDDIAYTIVADAYLPALTAAVQRYDTSGTIPQFMILLDAFYYHGRYGRLWMDVLEDPLHATIRFHAGETREEAHLRARLDSLRSAVSRSARLQREAATHGGERWIAQVVKVHVNVTLPSDFAFRSKRIVPPFPFTSDNLMRDHRKIVLYDFTEDDPTDGALLVTGVGIGEHYASVTWEDRGYRLRGPAALEARAAVRRALESNGFRPEQIPEPLRVATGPMSAGARADARDYVARVLQVHNQAGFGTKASSVARAMLYSLAPPGSVIIVPDPLWVSESWAAMLAGAAARGSQVVIIAPALANAPSPQPPLIALERAMLRRMVAIRDHLGTQFRDAGGELRVGVYASHAPVSDIAGRAAEVRDGLARAPWIRQLIPFDARDLAVLDRATTQTAQADAGATTIARDETPREPQLHQKTQFIARPGAIAALVRQPGWADILAQTMRVQSRETTRLADAIGAVPPPPDSAAIRAADALLQGYERSLSPADRKRITFYFSLGSQNHDPRGLMLDGEASVIVSGFQGSAGLVDLFYLMARTTWIENDAQIDGLVPAPRSLLARFAHAIRFAM